MIERSGREGHKPATNSAPRPGDFILGSRKSRAAARVLLDARSRPTHPPGFTLDLREQSLEQCQAIYAKAVLFRQSLIEDGAPYFVIRFPDGFTPLIPQTAADQQQDSPKKEGDFGDR